MQQSSGKWRDTGVTAVGRVSEVREDFGIRPDGRGVERVTLVSGGMTAKVLTQGAILQDLTFEGQPLVLGSDDLSDYLGHISYFGALVGRVANRISGGAYVAGGDAYSLDLNDPLGNCLHGGSDGTSMHLWTLEEASETEVRLRLSLPDGHMGFPGGLEIAARYSLDGATLVLEIEARSDADTVCSIAPHSYFNLDGSPKIDEHKLKIAADHYLPVDAQMAPTGEVRAVAGGGFDFRDARAMGDVSVDHNFCLADARRELSFAASLYGPKSGIEMQIYSTEPGLQVYDARHISEAGPDAGPDAGIAGSHGRRFGPRAGVAIETQNWPDAVTQGHFPPATLKRGEVFRARTEFRFARRGPAESS
jgi:aldose 1-epimerase